MRNWIIGFVVAVLALSAAALAHEGHMHKVLGTVASIAGNQVEVKATDGKVVTVMLERRPCSRAARPNSTPRHSRSANACRWTTRRQKQVNMAKTIKLAETPAAAKK